MSDLNRGVEPSLSLRKTLLTAGRDTHDALHVVNAFYSKELGANDNIHSDYWTKMVCVLAERIVKSERELDELKSKIRELTYRMFDY